jgi:hypothetical protein
MTYLGRFEELKEDLVESIALAENLDDLLAVVLLRTGITNLAWLAADEPGTALDNVEQGAGRWSQSSFQFQHALELASRTQIDVYTGAGEVALERLEQTWPKVARSHVLRVQHARATLIDLRARAGLAAGARLDAVERDARRLARESHAAAAAQAKMILACIEAARGRAAHAVPLFEGAGQAFEALGMRLHAGTARLRHGEALGGAIGDELAAEAIASLHSLGIASVSRMAQLIAPRPVRPARRARA